MVTLARPANPNKVALETLFTRSNLALRRCVSAMRMPATARAVYDAIEDWMFGASARCHARGYELVTRRLAAELGSHQTSIQRGVAWLLERGVLRRAPNPGVWRGFAYWIAAPSAWSWSSTVPIWSAELKGEHHDLAGGPVMLSRPGDRAVGGRTHQRVHTRAVPTTRSKRHPSWDDKIDTWWCLRGGKRRTLVLAVAEELHALYGDGWREIVEVITPRLVAWVAAGVAARDDRAGEWKPLLPVVRLALGRALHTTVVADEVEEQRRIEEVERMKRIKQWARQLVEQWSELRKREMPAEARREAEAAVERLQAGNLEEIEMAAVFLGLAEEQAGGEDEVAMELYGLTTDEEEEEPPAVDRSQCERLVLDLHETVSELLAEPKPHRLALDHEQWVERQEWARTAQGVADALQVALEGAAPRLLCAVLEEVWGVWRTMPTAGAEVAA